MLKRFLCFALCLTMLMGMTACGDESAREEQADNNAAAPVTPPTAVIKADSLSADDMRYVMIYNPKIYDEALTYDNSALNTGDLGLQVDPDAARGDELDPTEVSVDTLSQDHFGIPAELRDIELNRADVMATIYDLGDREQFYYYVDPYTNTRSSATFTCEYVGDHCYIWTYNSSLTASQIQSYGEAYDDDIFDTMSETFGDPRYDDKLHILFYPLDEGNRGSIILGCFCGLDMYASTELSPYEVSYYGVNTNVNLIHMNTVIAENPAGKDDIIATLGHEYQHLLICAAAFESNTVAMRTWLNEAMSGYTEDMLFPGTQEASGCYRQFAESDLIRHGQSLYNFTTTGYDIGVYSSVYLYAEYLANLAGTSVFSNIHSYWRSSYSSTLCEAEAIVESVPQDVYDRIDSLISYPSDTYFPNADEEWMSKLTLDFYLAQLRYDAGDPNAFRKIEAQTLLYDEINAADIEGGGRIIAAVTDNSFQIPDDAEDGMIYVGLNDNFEIVTDFVYR